MMRGGQNRQKALQGDLKKINKNTWKSLRRLLKYLSPYKITLVFAVIFAVLSTIFDIVGPFIMGSGKYQKPRNHKLWGIYEAYIYSHRNLPFCSFC